MKIHTDILTADDLRRATRGLPVFVELTERGSRDRARAFDVKLEGNGRRFGNSGRFGADHDRQSATWDEWGAWIGRLFEIDPAARFGDKAHPVYDGAEHYHWTTGGRFRQGIVPDDTHAAHRWERIGDHCTGSYTLLACKGRKGKPCGARQRIASVDTWRTVINTDAAGVPLGV